MNFGLLNLSLAGFTGLGLAAAFQHAFNFVRSRDRSDAFYALGMLSLAAGLVLSIAYNSARDVESFKFYYQLQALITRPFFFCWAYFVLRFSGFKSPVVYQAWIGLEVFKAILLLIFIKTPYFFDVKGISIEQTPWGESLASPTGAGTSLQFIQVLVPLANLGFCTAGALRLMRHGKRRRAWFLFSLAGLTAAVAVYDNLVDYLGLPDFKVIEFFTVAPVLLMGWAATDRLEAALRKRKEAQAQLFRSEQMRVLGQLAGGLAHDFNNVVAAVSMAGENLRASASAEALQDIDVIQRATKRAAELCTRLLSLGRRPENISKPQSVHEIIRGAVKLLQSSLKGGVVVELRLDAKNDRAQVDAQAIESVILNLGLNARDAMPQGGQLLIESDNLSLGGTSTERLRIRVSDQGEGMRREILEHIFEPFFTTKENGKGSGLGLAQAASIMAEHGGEISVESVPKQGSRFTLWLPLICLFFAILPAGLRAQTLPALRGVCLNGRMADLPMECAGRVTVLVMAFTRSGGEPATRWGKAFEADAGDDKQMVIYQVALLESAPSFVRPMILRAMRKKVPTPLQDRFVILKEASQTWEKIAGFDKKFEDDAYLLILDPQGDIKWVYHGDFTPAAKAELDHKITGLAHEIIRPAVK